MSDCGLADRQGVASGLGPHGGGSMGSRKGLIAGPGRADYLGKVDIINESAIIKAGKGRGIK